MHVPAIVEVVRTGDCDDGRESETALCRDRERAMLAGWSSVVLVMFSEQLQAVCCQLETAARASQDVHRWSTSANRCRSSGRLVARPDRVHWRCCWREMGRS